MSFDWDNFDIGNINLDHSQDYFIQKHLEHERLCEQTEEFKDKLVYHSKPIAMFRAEYLTARKKLSQEFREVDDLPVNKPNGNIKRRIEPVDAKKRVQCITSKRQTLPTKLSNQNQPINKVTIPRISRLTINADEYVKKRKEMIEKRKKEEEEKKKQTRFRARSLPRYLKAHKAALNANKVNDATQANGVSQQKRDGNNNPEKIVNKIVGRVKLRRSRSASDINKRESQGRKS